jgi:ribosomal protein S6--L-glutamate ligase
MNLGVLISENSWYWHDLQRAAGHDVTLHALSFATLSAAVGAGTRVGCRQRQDLAALDALLVRSMPPGSLEQVVFRMNTLHRLAAAGLPVFNPPRCLEIAIDKYLALAELQAAGLPVAETRCSQTWEQAWDDFHELGGDVVVKPLFGGEGRGITRVNDEAVAWRVFRTYSQLGCVIYQQQFIRHPGYDFRVLVVGQRLLGMRRRNDLDWRTNIGRGAEAEPMEVDETTADLSRRAARAVGAPLAGVDLLPGPDGQLYLLEVNAVPGWRALAGALQVDVAALVVGWIREQLDASAC